MHTVLVKPEEEGDMTEVRGSQPQEQSAETADAAEREAVRKQLQLRRDFSTHVLAFVVINTAIVLIWLTTGRGYFWPAWMIGLWGVGLVMHAWDAFMRRTVTERDIEEAMRMRSSRRR
jgi:hypothetical protein